MSFAAIDQMQTPCDKDESTAGIHAYRRLDLLLAALTLLTLILYLLLPEARYGVLVMLFIPVCASGFYLHTWRSGLVGCAASLIVALSLITGMIPVWPDSGHLQVLTVAAWAVSLGCCSICVSGLSASQWQAMADMQETHLMERMLDGLTGVMNRSAFEQHLRRLFQESRKRKKRLSVMVVDVDHFKKFNDRYGHQAGDFVLVEVARVLQDSLREKDIVARYGGEEFVVLLPDTPSSIACQAAERIRRTIENTRFRHEGNVMRLTVSIGAAELQLHETASEFFDRADAALYASKEASRNCVYFHDGKELLPLGASLAVYENDSSRNRSLDAIAEDGYLEQCTGLPHRRVFHEVLKRRVVEAHRYRRELSLLVIRCEECAAAIRLGSDAEAKLLSLYAETIGGCMRDCDMGSRTGHFEFAVLLPDTSLSGATVPAQRFLKDLKKSRRPMYRGTELHTTAYVGVAALERLEDLDSFVARARDAAERAASQKLASCALSQPAVLPPS